MNKDEALQERLRVIRKGFFRKLPSRLTRIEDNKNQWLQTQDQEAYAAFYRDIHSLAGSASTFGAEELGIQARELTNMLKTFAQAPLPNEAQRQTIDALLTNLHQIVETHVQ